jgi:serine-type D-Ala-D-Ala carboxypeptidase (penicillin-binding protein 5/6)
MLRRVFLLIAFFAAAGLSGVTARAQTIESPAAHAILLDDTTGVVLFEKNADEQMAPASMSKLMTLFMVFERLRDGSISLEDTMRVSEAAWRMGGSRMFVEHNSRVSVAELMKGVIIQSGNDASVVFAEGLGADAKSV